MKQKRPLILLLLLMLTGATSYSSLNLGVVDVSAVPLSPYIMIVPEQTVNSTITPGMNYTISVITDYDGSDIWQWQFELFYNPDVLEGLEVRNGDLITTAKDPRATWLPGTFDNTVGHLDITLANFFPIPKPPPTTSGPGTLANVTFGVKGTGVSTITLGEALLQGYDNLTDTYPEIIYQIYDPGATQPPYGSDHIGHGYFNNIPPIHDIAVTKIVAPTTAVLGANVTIGVTVANEGNFTESFNVTLSANATEIGKQSVTSLASANSTVLSFIWNTSSATAGIWTLNATTSLLDDDLSDNNRTASIELKQVHDIAIVSLEVPSEATIGETVPINVTVANHGSFDENVNLTVTYEPTVPQPEPIPNSTKPFLLGKIPATETISIPWNTTGLAKAGYNITATVTIPEDENLTDNSESVIMQLKLGHDVAITSVSADPNRVFVGELVQIQVKLSNPGGYNETSFEVKLTYSINEIKIDTKLVESLPSGNSTTLFFDWNTSEVTPGIYPIMAEAILPEDLNQENNKKIYLSVSVNMPAGNIEGIVTNAYNGSRIQGATVTAGTYTNTTDASGHYIICDVPVGTYVVTASKNGYYTNSTSIEVLVGQKINLNFTLTSLPTDGNIAGTVLDASTGNPIEGANVTANGYFDITDANGHYNITSVPAGNHTVTASKDGYHTNSTSIDVVAAQTTSVDFQLTPKESLNILPYVIVAVVAIIAIAGIAFFLRSRKEKAK